MHWTRTSGEEDKVRNINMTSMLFYTLLLVHLFACPAVTQRSSRALYPLAYRIKRGTYSLVNPTFQRSKKDIDLLFEILEGSESEAHGVLWGLPGLQWSESIKSGPTMVNKRQVMHAGSKGLPVWSNPTDRILQLRLLKKLRILLAGMQIEGRDHRLSIPDEELASLGRVKRLEVICEDVLPKKLSEVRRLADQLSRRRVPIRWEDYERTVLTLVYITQTLAQLGREQPREAWGDVLVQLFNALHKDLTTS